MNARAVRLQSKPGGALISGWVNDRDSQPMLLPEKMRPAWAGRIIRHAGAVYCLVMRNSTRRFRARPSAVPLEATGSASP